MSFGYVMVPVPEPLATDVRGFGSSIPEVFLTGKGAERFVHVTACSGIESDVSIIRSMIGRMSPFQVTLGCMSVFNSEDEIVLKLSAQGAGLVRMFRSLSVGLRVVDTHLRAYRPHITIAYLKKDNIHPYYYQAFYTDKFSGKIFLADRVLFSDSNGNKSIILLGSSEDESKKEEELYENRSSKVGCGEIWKH